MPDETKKTEQGLTRQQAVMQLPLFNVGALKVGGGRSVFDRTEELLKDKQGNIVLDADGREILKVETLKLRKRPDIAAGLGVKNSKDNAATIDAHMAAEKKTLLRQLKAMVASMEEDKFEGIGLQNRRGSDGLHTIRIAVKEAKKRGRMFTDEEMVAFLNNNTSPKVPWTVETYRAKVIEQENKLKGIDVAQAPAGELTEGQKAPASKPGTPVVLK